MDSTDRSDNLENLLAVAPSPGTFVQQSAEEENAVRALLGLPPILTRSARDLSANQSSSSSRLEDLVGTGEFEQQSEQLRQVDNKHRPAKRGRQTGQVGTKSKKKKTKELKLAKMQIPK